MKKTVTKTYLRNADYQQKKWKVVVEHIAQTHQKINNSYR